MTKWTKEYDNDTGPCDDYFEEWWNVTDGSHTYRCNNSEDADFLIKTLAQEQEPLGWVDDGGMVFWKDKPPADGSDIYTAPPQCTWVGLTGEILISAAQSSLPPDQYEHFVAISEYEPEIYDRLAKAIQFHLKENT